MDAKSYKTAEFWLTLLCVVLTMAMASGALGEQSGAYKAIEMGLACLATMGYQFSRASVKKAMPVTVEVDEEVAEELEE